MEGVETSTGPRGGNLAVPLSTFVGRHRESVRLAALVQEHRLVSVVGPGGAGKTRLALEVLRGLDDADIDGPWMVELAGIDDGDLVVPAVSQTLGLTGQGGGAGAIVAAVAGRRTVIMLDNCEQVVDRAAELAASLATAAGDIHVVVTSREPLAVPGEAVLLLDPLDVDAGWKLFADRAAHALPGFRLAPGEEEIVEAIVRDLDGLPLAIELAAARVPVLSLPRLANLLTDRLEVLAGHGRTTPPRHRTLSAAIAWSHRLLDADEQELFAALSVFRDGFELDAVCGICDLGELAAATRLGSLVAKSMVVVRTQESGGRRYHLLESLRQFGAARLEAGAEHRLRTRHARWFADLADDAERHLRGAEAVAWLGRLRRDQDNLRAAAEFALAAGELETAVRIVGAQSWYWYRRGFVEEGRLWHERVRDAGAEVDPWLRSRAGIGAASLAYLAGDVDGGMDDLRRGYEAALEAGDETRQAVAQLYFGYFETMGGDLEAAMRHFMQARELARRGVLEDWAVAEVDMLVGQLQRLQGDPGGGLETTLHARAVAEGIGHRWSACSCGWLGAKILLQLGDVPRAAAILGEVVRALAEDEDTTSLLVGLHTMAVVAARSGRPREAVRLIGGVDAVGDRVGYHPESMDRIDGTAYREEVLASLPPGEVEAERRRGSVLGMSELVELALVSTSSAGSSDATATA